MYLGSRFDIENKIRVSLFRQVFVCFEFVCKLVSRNSYSLAGEFIGFQANL